MFIDHVTITTKAGKGGDGIVAFRREKYVPLGGPAGGNGGRGGHVIIEAEEGLSTLLEYRYQKNFKAPEGGKGMSKGQFGKDANDIVLKVPVGTIIRHQGHVIADLTSHKQQVIVARGGRGGRGNIAFATTKHPAPELAENGEPGQMVELEMELKLLADVGLIGLPSVGKSTIISVISAAKPKIADYPFTTIRPNLGVASVHDHSFVVADMPGLIEGASQGAGLGIQFLRHIERTRILVHVVDATHADQILSDIALINEELISYNADLGLLPQLIVVNKVDVINADELASLQHLLPDALFISAATNQGIPELLGEMWKLLEQHPVAAVKPSQVKDYTFTPPSEAFEIHLGPDNVYEVRGENVEKLMQMTDFAKPQNAKRFARQLRSMGIDDALRAKGLQSGDTVRILDFEFEYLD
jgi:GTPase